jgi:hypothetical protein
MNRSYVLKAFERTRKRALSVSSSLVPSSSASRRFWSRLNAFSSSPLREQHEQREVSGTRGNEPTSVTETERSVRRKEEPQNKFLESLRRETVENLVVRVSDAEEDFKPPTRTFSLREKTFREKRGELNMLPKEINGPRGLEPTRFKDWEVGGRCTDF